MDFSKALIIVVLSYAMRKLENMAPFLVFLWHYLTNLWQCHQALIPLAGGVGLVRVGACVEARRGPQRNTRHRLSDMDM
jgi:hypothetical protein